MNKKWLALGLAAMMSFACLAACGDNGDNNGNNDNNDEGNNVIKGEQVTEEQWISAAENVDYKYVVFEEWYQCVDIASVEGEEAKEIWYDTTHYSYEKETYVEESENINELFEEWEWEVLRGGTVYDYYKEEGDGWEGEVSNAGPWKEIDWRRQYNGEFETADEYFYADSREFLEEWESGYYSMEDFTFDEEKGVYYMTEVESDEESTENIRFEILFLDGKLYSLKYIFDYRENDPTENYSEEGYEMITFKKETIPQLPDEEGLNALIEQNA